MMRQWLRDIFNVDHGRPIGWDGGRVYHVEIVSYLRRKLRRVHFLRLRLGRVAIVSKLLIFATLIAVLVHMIQSEFKGKVPVNQPLK